MFIDRELHSLERLELKFGLSSEFSVVIRGNKQSALWVIPLSPGGRYSLLLTLFQTIKCHFPHPFSDLEEVIKRNITSLHKTAVIIAEIRTSTKRFLKIHLEFAYYTCLLIHLDLKLRTRSCKTVVPSTIPDSRPK